MTYEQLLDENNRLKRTISAFKKYDTQRKTILLNQLEEISSLQSEVERLQMRVDELLDSFRVAPPMKSNPEEKAYVYELLDRIVRYRYMAEGVIEDIGTTSHDIVLALDREREKTTRLYKLNKELLKTNKQLSKENRKLERKIFNLCRRK